MGAAGGVGGEKVGRLKRGLWGGARAVAGRRWWEGGRGYGEAEGQWLEEGGGKVEEVTGKLLRRSDRLERKAVKSS